MLTLLVAAAASAHIPVLVYATPDDDWCALFANTENSGDIVLLAPGDYYGPCDLVGRPPNQYNEYSTLTAQFSDYRPRIHWDGASDHVISVDGQFVELAWLVFPEIPTGVDAVRFVGGTTHWVLDSEFDVTGGTAIRANADIASLRLTELNVHGDGTGTGVSLGCPDGSCSISTLSFDDSLLTSLALGAAIDSADGYATDNVIDATTAIDVAGVAPGLWLQRNLMRGLVSAHGPSTWENNISVGPFRAAPAAGAWSDVKLYGNTLYDPAGVPLDLEGWTSDGGFVFQDNAVGGEIPAAEGAFSGNVACTDPGACWNDAPGLDLYPNWDGPLTASGVVADPGSLYDDWCGYARPDVPTVGAFERYGGSLGTLPFDVKKRQILCTPLGADTGLPGGTDTGDTDLPGNADTGSSPKDGGAAADGGSSGGCGCDSSRTIPAAPWLAVFALVARRKSRLS